MNQKEQNEKYKSMGLTRPTDADIIKAQVNRLIEWLYKPVEDDLCWVADGDKLEQLSISGEPINWGDLKCTEVDMIGNVYKVYVDEAAPNDCPNLCAYIERFMKAWGWNVEVITEW